MKQTWQTKLAAFAKRHPALRAPVLVLLWVGFKLSAAAEACGQKWDASWDAKPAHARQYSWRLRVLSLSMALLVGLAALPAARYRADEVPGSELSLVEGPEAFEEVEPNPEDATLDDSLPVDDGAGTDEGGDTGETGEGPTEEGSAVEEDAGADESEGGETDDSTGAEDGADGGEDENGENDDNQTGSDAPVVVTGFAGLAAAVAHQEYPLGTPLDEVQLPASLEVTLAAQAAEGAEPASDERIQGAEAAGGQADASLASEEDELEPADSAARTEPAEPADSTFQAVPVSWLAQPEYDAEQEGDYLFTPVLPEGVVLAEGAVPPTITVALGESELEAQAGSTIFVKAAPAGDDGNSGTTKDDPLATLKKAVEVVDDNGVIVLLSDLPGQGNIPRVSKSYTIQSDTGKKYAVSRSETNAAFIYVNNSCSLTLKDLIINGSDPGGSTEPSSLIRTLPSSDTVTLDNATLQGNGNNASIIGGSVTTGGGAITAVGGTINMINGSAILNNKAKRGGGVYLDQVAVMTVSAGCRIADNDAPLGGGVALEAGGTLSLEGGEISGNNEKDSYTYGKDVYLDGSVDLPNALHIHSGVIGSPGVSGGGLYLVDTAMYGAPADQIVVKSALSAPTTIYVENGYDASGETMGPAVATFGSSVTSSRDKYLSAARFVDPRNPMATGTVASDGYVKIVPPSPVILHYALESSAAYAPTYHKSLDAALEARVAAGAQKTAFITLRDDLSGDTSVKNVRTMPLDSTTTFRSEPGASIKRFTYDEAGTAFRFLLEGNRTITFDSVILDDKGATGAAVVVNGGKFNLNSSSTIATARTGVSVSGGTFTQAGTVDAASAGVAVDVTGGTYTLSGAVKNTTGTGVRVSGGTTNASMSGGSIKSTDGNGALVSSGTFAMTGGSITSTSGNGVQVNGGTLAVSGGAVTGCGGAGVVVDGGTLNLSGGGAISNNGNHGVR
ncbi:hypothetical protein LJC64_05485, partial [Ruminococcaceae bacterium OttesenSCG-928-A11]|nr:hypothetical protein [Ruminococcaceae bacterium OttesenSCG-928-A11]